MHLTFTIHKPADEVFDYLTDMQKFVSVHPVITKIELLAENEYKIYETLKAAGISFSFSYTVRINYDLKNKRVGFCATVMKFTQINMAYQLTAQEDHTTIDEVITFRSPLPVKSIMARIFKKQHTQLFKNIEAAKI